MHHFAIHKDHIKAITMVSNQLNTLFAALAGAERIFDVLDEEVETDEGDVRLVRDGKDALTGKSLKKMVNMKKLPLRVLSLLKMLTLVMCQVAEC